MHPVVTFEKVSKTYAMGHEALEVHALREVSFELFAGESVAIMGASGSGKSTALNIIGTLDRPSSGRYLLDGEPASSLGEDDLAVLRNRKIGFVFQSFHLLPRLTAIANVELPMVYAGVRPRERSVRARAALARVGLDARGDHFPNQLSGGQQQRVAIARAIVNDPVLLLADEPTGALDSATSRSVMDLFGSLHAQGITVVLVTHDPAIAGHAQRVLTFADGHILADRRATGVAA